MAVDQSMPDRILDATERLLARYGYRKMTMDDIAQEAGIGKRTIYVHFPSKEEVALASIDRVVARLQQRLRELSSGPDSVSRRLRYMLLCRVLFRFDSVRDYSHSLDDLFESLRPAYMARRQRYFAQEAAIFTEILSEGMAAGVFRRGDPTTQAHTLLLATNSLLPYSLSIEELGQREEVEARAGHIADLLLAGLQARAKAGKGRHTSHRSSRDP
jgi:AcrR family transcriptional regulator